MMDPSHPSHPSHRFPPVQLPRTEFLSRQNREQLVPEQQGSRYCESSPDDKLGYVQNSPSRQLVGEDLEKTQTKVVVYMILRQDFIRLARPYQLPCFGVLVLENETPGSWMRLRSVDHCGINLQDARPVPRRPLPSDYIDGYNRACIFRLIVMPVTWQM